MNVVINLGFMKFVFRKIDNIIVRKYCTKIVFYLVSIIVVYQLPHSIILQMDIVQCIIRCIPLKVNHYDEMLPFDEYFPLDILVMSSRETIMGFSTYSYDRKITRIPQNQDLYRITK